jgi:hypothetical protein
VELDPGKWPDAATIGYLITRGLQMEFHCMKCAHYALRDPADLGFDLATPIPALAGQFKCSRCGSTETEARPHYTR